jgi:hypothetical protein
MQESFHLTDQAFQRSERRQARLGKTDVDLMRYQAVRLVGALLRQSA